MSAPQHPSAVPFVGLDRREHAVSDARLLASDEPERLVALWRSGWMDKPPSESFRRVTRSVAELLQVPIVLISLLDDQHEWFLASHGPLAQRELPRAVSFCTPVIEAKAALNVVDAWVDPRLAANPFVSGSTQVRSYLGVPLFCESGQALGTLSVMDRRVRTFRPAEREVLTRYAQAVALMLQRDAAVAV